MAAMALSMTHGKRTFIDTDFPDLLNGISNEDIENEVDRIRGNTAEMIILDDLYDAPHVYDAIGYDFDQAPITNTRLTPTGRSRDFEDNWPTRQYVGTKDAKPRVTKRQKVLRARALNKVNRKRARK